MTFDDHVNQHRITAREVPTARRIRHVASQFGVAFPLLLEPAVYRAASALSEDYAGGHWRFMALSNGGFYMAPGRERLRVTSPNGYAATMSGDAFGITACLFAYSDLSFRGDSIAEVCAEHFQRLRGFAVWYPAGGAILAACD